MTRPVRLQLSRRKGFDLQAHSRAANGLPAVTVARPGPWGNPFVVGKHGDAAYCVDLYKALLAGLLRVGADPDIDALEQVRTHAGRHLDDLASKNLACWCKPGKPCHADVLLELANRPICEEVGTAASATARRASSPAPSGGQGEARAAVRTKP